MPGLWAHGHDPNKKGQVRNVLTKTSLATRCMSIFCMVAPWGFRCSAYAEGRHLFRYGSDMRWRKLTISKHLRVLKQWACRQCFSPQFDYFPTPNKSSHRGEPACGRSGSKGCETSGAETLHPVIVTFDKLKCAHRAASSMWTSVRDCGH